MNELDRTSAEDDKKRRPYKINPNSISYKTGQRITRFLSGVKETPGRLANGVTETVSVMKSASQPDRLTEAHWADRPTQISGVDLRFSDVELLGANIEDDAKDAIQQVWLRFFAEVNDALQNNTIDKEQSKAMRHEAFVSIKQNGDGVTAHMAKEYIKTLVNHVIDDEEWNTTEDNESDATPEQVEQQKGTGMLRALFDRVREKREKAQKESDNTIEEITEKINKLKQLSEDSAGDETRLLLTEIDKREKILSTQESPNSPRLNRLQRVKEAVQSAPQTLRRLEARGGTAGGQKDYNPENLILGQANKALEQMARDNLENANRHARKSGSHLRKGIEGIAAILYGVANVVSRPAGAAYEATRTLTSLGASGLEVGAAGMAKVGKTAERAAIVGGGAVREAAGKSFAGAVGRMANIPEVSTQIDKIASTRQERMMADQAKELRELTEALKEMAKAVDLSSRKMKHIEDLIETGRLKAADIDTE